jgi:hypothetical protein
MPFTDQRIHDVRPDETSAPGDQIFVWLIQRRHGFPIIAEPGSTVTSEAVGTIRQNAQETLSDSNSEGMDKNIEKAIQTGRSDRLNHSQCTEIIAQIAAKPSVR